MVLLGVAGCGSGDGPDDEALGRRVAASVSSGAVEASDDAGRRVRLDRPAQRIVSLLPGTTETLVAMGAEGQLVARTDYDDPSLGHLPSVGGGLTPSLEILTSLKPDLVIAWEEAGTARIRPRLEALGIAVFAVQTRDTTGIFANIERLGVLSGRVESADSLAGWMRAEFDAIRASVAGLERPDVLYMIGLDPPMVAGPHVFIGEVLEVAGGRNVFEEISAPSPQMSLEEIVRRRPDVVLVPASGVATTRLDLLMGQPGWRELAESGETRFHALPPDVLHRPGPSIVEAAWILRDAIHPDLASRE